MYLFFYTRLTVCACVYVGQLLFVLSIKININDNEICERISQRNKNINVNWQPPNSGTKGKGVRPLDIS